MCFYLCVYYNVCILSFSYIDCGICNFVFADLNPVHTSNNVEITLLRATKSNVASTNSKVA